MAAAAVDVEEEEEVLIDEPVIEAQTVDFGSPPAHEVSAPVEPEPIEELELLDEEEFVNLTDAEMEAEEPPASSRRPKAAESMDEALAGAAEQLDMEEGREIPLKTPPPESGPQAAPPPQAHGAAAAPRGGRPARGRHRRSLTPARARSSWARPWSWKKASLGSWS